VLVTGALHHNNKAVIVPPPTLKENSSMDNARDSVRKKLIQITNQGLMLKAITRNTGIDGNDLSRFKHGMDCLENSDIKILSAYLDCIVIPQWNIVTSGSEKKMSARERLLASRDASSHNTKLQNQKSVSSFDILNEFL
jgi:hypothetical protein